MNADDVVGRAAKVLYDNNHLTPTDWADAWVLAERLDAAGLLARPLPTREEIANALHGDQCPDDPDLDESCSCGAGDYDRMGDIVLALLKGQDR